MRRRPDGRGTAPWNAGHVARFGTPDEALLEHLRDVTGDSDASDVEGVMMPNRVQGATKSVALQRREREARWSWATAIRTRLPI